jgi:hypothetical protein
MHFKEITPKSIKKMCSWLEFYDTYGYLPFEKKKIGVSLSKGNILKLQEKAKRENKSVSQVLDYIVTLEVGKYGK